MKRFKVIKNGFSCFLRSLLLYIVLPELHEGGLGLVKSLDYQALSLVHLKVTESLEPYQEPITSPWA